MPNEVKRNSVTVELSAGPCRVLGLDALIRAKEALGRPRDREAVLQLKAIRERLAAEGRLHEVLGDGAGDACPR